jgi:hypothetical protein
MMHAFDPFNFYGYEKSHSLDTASDFTSIHVSIMQRLISLALLAPARFRPADRRGRIGGLT